MQILELFRATWPRTAVIGGLIPSIILTVIGVLQSLSLAQPAGGQLDENFGYNALLRLQNAHFAGRNIYLRYAGAGQLVQSLSLPGSAGIVNGWNAAGLLNQTTLNSRGRRWTATSTPINQNGSRSSVTRFNNAMVN